MAARVVRRAPLRRRQSNVSWGGFQVPATVIPVETKLILGSFILATQFDETVLRVRGEIMATSDQTALLERAEGALGMIVVSEDAFAAGISAVPGPVSDIGNDGWFLWQAYTTYFDLIQGMTPHFITIDSKAKRIIREGSRIAVVAEGAASPEATACIVQGYFRVLSMFRS